MKDWQQFEALIASIHRVLNSADYDVETDVFAEEPSGARHQIDVRLRPKTPFSGPVLISCKASTSPVGIDHVREWSDIVQHTGSASGVIVAQAGFTSAAIEAARNPERRVSLWHPRQLTPDDFAPDDKERDGYIARVQTRCVFRIPRLVEGSLEIDVEPVDARDKGREVAFSFSAAESNRWHLRDQQDNVAENLWEVYTGRGAACRESSVVEFTPPEPRFLVLSGVRLRLIRFAFAVEVIRHERLIEVDVLSAAIGYQNVVTRELKLVPLNQLGQLPRR